MRGSHFAIQLFVAFLFYMVHFKMLAKVCSLKVQAERISKNVHSKGAHFFFWWCISKCGPLPNGLLRYNNNTKVLIHPIFYTYLCRYVYHILVLHVVLTVCYICILLYSSQLRI